MLDVNNSKNKYIYTMDDPTPLILNDCIYVNLQFPKPNEEAQSFIDGFFSKNY